MAKDYYEILGVAKNASQDEIKRAFRTLAHKHHPDKSGGDAEQFKQINEAYQTLSDPAKRSRYDQFGAAAGSPGGMNWNDFQQSGGFNQTAGFGDLGDIFGDLFGFGGRSRQRAARGGDAEVDLSIDFREAVFGAERVVELSGPHQCEICRGTGGEPGSGTTTCTTCKGSGVVERTQQTILGALRSQATCSTCGGSGSRPKKSCKHCRGTGQVRSKRQLRLTIPAGIDDQQTIRLRGQGEPGPVGSEPGDLYVRVRVRPDPMFRRDGFDLLTRRAVTISQAALGDKIPVETVDGEVELTIPAGTHSGKLFRLSGKGVTRIDGRGRGDQIVEILVKIPDKLSKEQRKLLQQLKSSGL
ncbi:MAG: molecular chaperone DnaJ [Candidatus Kerfeldbacteria bacterium]|nr:molecular chaperone DnaJ [Candidatus Kerfeldbacteria bacterium]